MTRIEGSTRPSRWEVLAIALISAALTVTLVALAAETGVTVDEPSHILSASRYWEGRDNLKPGDMPPLIKLAGGWVPLLAGLHPPAPNHPVWATGHEWYVSQQMMADMTGPEIRRIFFWSRLPLLVFPLGCLALLWWWSRQLFSPVAAFLTACLFALAPIVLGHGALFKNDLAACFGHLLFWYSAWRFWALPDRRRSAWLGISLLVAILAKMSLLVLVPIALCLMGARYLSIRPLNLRPLGLNVLLVLGIVYAGVVAAWQFELGQLARSDFDVWRAHPLIPSWLVTFVKLASRIPSPPEFWRGAVGLVQSNAEMPRVYFLGDVHSGGHPLYFLLAMAVKIPIATQIFVAAGMISALAGFYRRQHGWRDLFWVAPAIFYVTLASLSNLQLGFRLAMPAVPFLLLFPGCFARAFERSRMALLISCVLLCWLGWRVVGTYPHYISYFNLWAGGPDNGIRYLSDSNLDWGQDLRYLARYVNEHKIPKIQLAYFGTDNPYAYLNPDRLQTMAPPWSPDMVKSTRLHPEPGFYAISATLLTGQFFSEKYVNYYSDFRNRAPLAKAGNSIFIYKVP